MTAAAERSLADELLPIFDVSDSVAVVVGAPVSTTWEALLEVDLIDVARRHSSVAILGGLRALPALVSHALHGEAPASPPASLRLKDAATMPPAQGGWLLLGEGRHEIALGMAGKFWRPVIAFADITAERFATFDEPGYAKTIYVLAAAPIDANRTLLTGTMRTATTDEHARRWFQRYWTLGVGSGAHLLVHHLLDTARTTAEARAADAALHDDA